MKGFNTHPRNPKQPQNANPQGTPGYQINTNPYYPPHIPTQNVYGYNPHMYSPNNQHPNINSRPHRSGGIVISNPETHEPVVLNKSADSNSPVVSQPAVVSQSPAKGPTKLAPATGSADSEKIEKKNAFREMIQQRALEAKKAEEEAAAKKKAEEEAAVRRAEEEAAAKKAEEEAAAKRKVEEEEAAKRKAEEEAAAAAAAKKAEEEEAAKKKLEEEEAAKKAEEAKKQVSEEAVQAALASVNDKIKSNSNPFKCLQNSAKPSPENVMKLTYPEGITKSLVPSTDKLYIYDNQFLLQFQSVVTFPPKENWDEIRSIMTPEKSSSGGFGRQYSNRSSSSRGGNFQSMGNFGSNFRNERSNSSFGGMKNMGRMSSNNLNALNNMGPSKSGRNNSSRRGRNDRSGSNRGDRFGKDQSKENKEEDQDSPKPPPVPIVRSANAWVPRKRTTEATETKLSPEEVQRKVKSLLNKLSLEFFDAITDQIIEITDQSKLETDGRTLRQVLELAFAKAVDEPHWSRMYALLCSKMTNKVNPEIHDDQILDSKGNYLKGGLLFRKYLLTKCQQEFEKGWSDKLPTNPDGSPLDADVMSDEYYAAVAAKRRGLGLIKFIGELFILNLLKETIIHACFKLLLSKNDPSEETIESLCKLMTTVGSRLDASDKARVDVYFSLMTDIQNTPGLPSRLRFMIMDVVDLRKNNWIDAKNTNKGPKTIAEIHEDAKREKEKQAAQQAANKSRFVRSNGNNNNSNTKVTHDDLKRLSNPSLARHSSSASSFAPTSMIGRDGSGRSSSKRSSYASSNASNAGVPLSKEPSRQSSQRASNSFAALAAQTDDADA